MRGQWSSDYDNQQMSTPPRPPTLPQFWDYRSAQGNLLPTPRRRTLLPPPAGQLPLQRGGQGGVPCVLRVGAAAALARGHEERWRGGCTALRDPG